MKLRYPLLLLPLVVACADVPGGVDDAPADPGSAPVSIPLHGLIAEDSLRDLAPTDLTLTRLEGEDLPQVGDSWLLKASATDPEGGAVEFRWHASSGELSAEEGDEVRWTATSAVREIQITVTASDAGGNAAHAEASLRTAASDAEGSIDLDDQIGYWCNLELESDDTPHIVFRNATHPTLQHARWVSDAWEITTVEGQGLDIGGDAGHHIAAAMDGDTLHVVYGVKYSNVPQASYNFTLNYARWQEGDGWQLASVGEYYGSEPAGLAMALDPTSHKPTVLYTNGTTPSEARLLRCQGDCLNPESWSDELVWQELRPGTNNTSDRLYVGDLAFDDDGHVHAVLESRFYSSSTYYSWETLYLNNMDGAFGEPETLRGPESIYYSTQTTKYLARIDLDSQGRPLVMSNVAVHHKLADGEWSTSDYRTASDTSDSYYRFDIEAARSGLPSGTGQVFMTYPRSTTLELIRTDERGYFHYAYLGNIYDEVLGRSDLAIDSEGEPHACWVYGGTLYYQ